ncbi:MAG: M28 family peptidase [Anaerolineales bacterium]
MTDKRLRLYLSLIGLLLAAVTGWYAFAFWTQPGPASVEFDGQRTLADVQAQVSFGPRTPGSAGQARVLEWMRSELAAAGWDSRIQSAEMLGHPIQNVIAWRAEEPPQVILAAHYDTRLFADQDPDLAKRGQPVPGANDGASGVAVLLELARSLPPETPPLWMVFFDAEDNGRISDWDWLLGSRAFVAQLEPRPEAVVIVDMVGDADQQIYLERNSTPTLATEIWQTAADLGYAERFIAEPKYSMLDDHTPFLEAGLAAVDIIDFDYPYWHTTADTPDKVSAESLAAVGKTLREWLLRR